ncbi:hypothetical protein STXM2123_5842 [Streptomyces sp. F-3]|nr:hypothetical protein STXM2123_5842 [Streptomyces sp. F-3]
MINDENVYGGFADIARVSIPPGLINDPRVKPQVAEMGREALAARVAAVRR